MRLFTGISIAPTVRKNLDKLLQQLRPTAPLRWSRVENLHITTKFIGEWPEESVNDLIDALDEVPPPGKIDLAIRGLGWFPNPHSPRVFWCGIDAPPALAALAGATDQKLAAIGVQAESKKFAPHLTLARVDAGAKLLALQQAVAALHSVAFGGFTATEFHLFLSELGPGGSKYTKLADFPLEDV
jgi:RNA 2',3'-cyclic 3'-phosphodiesterase